MADKRELNQKLNDRRGGPTGVSKKADVGRQRDAKHQGAAKK